MYFKNRVDAGEQLAKLISDEYQINTVVLALPRGGIPLAVSIANKISAPLDIILSKKIGHPLHPEFAIGAIGENGEAIINKDIDLDQKWLQSEIKKIEDHIKNKRKIYNDILKKQNLNNKNILIVDDGIATGMTIFAAIKAVKEQNPAKIILAVPVIPSDSYLKLTKVVDEIVTIEKADHFLGAVGAYYQSFPQLSDQEVIKILSEHKLE